MLNPNRELATAEMIKAISVGTSRGSALATIGKKWRLSLRTFDRYWKKAHEDHQRKQDSIKAAVAVVEIEAAVEAAKKDIMTAEERKMYLTQLIRGDVDVPFQESKWDSNQKKFVLIKGVEKASHTARINAIAELNKMDGDYAAQKLEVGTYEVNHKWKTVWC